LTDLSITWNFIGNGVRFVLWSVPAVTARVPVCRGNVAHWRGFSSEIGMTVRIGQTRQSRDLTYIVRMTPSPVLPQEEYVEQAYFFAGLRERLAAGQPAQEVLRHLRLELLATTQLSLAVDFMLGELRHSGQLSTAMVRLPHYFTPLQTHIVEQAERDTARFTFEQALLLLEREARYRSESASPAGLFIYQFEALSRNNLGFETGLRCMERDGFYDESWRHYIRLVRSQLGIREIAELVFARSSFFVSMRRRQDPDYRPSFAVLFEEKAGRIASASIGKDPMYLFSTLQRHLGYPEVPRPPKPNPVQQEFAELTRRVKALETRLTLLEAEVTGKADLSQFLVKNPPATTLGTGRPEAGQT
jgi:hypothetical protein